MKEQKPKTTQPSKSKAAPVRRMGAEDSKQRVLFIDAAEELLRSEGYVAISARQVAAQAGLKTQLLYYYFRTMDDLILAVVKRINERRLRRFHEALAAPEPLRALWELNSDPTNATLSAELTTIATHREAVRAEIIREASAFRALQRDAVTRLIGKRAGKNLPAAGLLMLA
ncbi:MAG TPA: helix-turn-helix domain-containing protein, partial [Solimonas sp.]|nr:helix-turn-helix domain-containing protein [Solimonas sp.]